MALEALGYIGIRSQDLEGWASYATRFLGMQLVDKTRTSLAQSAALRGYAPSPRSTCSSRSPEQGPALRSSR